MKQDSTLKASPTCPTKQDHLCQLAYFELKNKGKKHFKSPLTVKFAPYKDAKVFQIDCNNYKIVTHADSQNGFGATVRSIVSVKIVFKEDMVKLANLDIHPY